MEGFTHPETPASPEIIEKSFVLQQLRENGFGDPKTEQIVMQWTEQKERQVGNSVIEQLVLDCERSDLYLATRDIDGALEILESVLEQTQNANQNPEQEKELYQEVLLRIEKIQSQYASR